MTKTERAKQLETEAEYAKFLEQFGAQLNQREEQRANRQVLQQAARSEMFLNRLEKAIQKGLEQTKPIVGGYTLKRAKHPTSRILTALWSDLHFGAGLKASECRYEYGPVQEARRMARIVEQIALYKQQYRDHTSLQINLLGDIMEGHLHDQRFAQDHDVQVGAAFHILRQGIEFLATQFPSVNITCQVGNHGRRKSRHMDRANQGKADSYEGGIYQCLKSYFEGGRYPNVKVDFQRKPYGEYKIFDEWCFTTHGDTVMNPGNPGSAIDVKGLIQKTNNWNASPKHHRYALFSVGHVHFPSAMYLPNGCAFITNGCLIPSGPFGESMDSPEVSCGQWIWESVPGFVLGDHRFIRVDENTDKNPAFDKIIRPFTWQQ